MKYEEKLLLERSFLVMKLLHLLLISSLPFQTETLKKWFIYIWFPSTPWGLRNKQKIPDTVILTPTNRAGEPEPVGAGSFWLLGAGAGAA